MFITSWTIDIRMNIQIWLLYRRYKSEWYNFWWATIQDIAACACKVWTLFGQACGQEECSQMTMMTTTTTDKSWLHRLATDILSWAKKHCCAFLALPTCCLRTPSSTITLVTINLHLSHWSFIPSTLETYTAHRKERTPTNIGFDWPFLK